MLTNWLCVTIHAGQWSRVEPLLSQAERAIADAEENEQQSSQAVSRGSSGRIPTPVQPAGAAKANRALIDTSKVANWRPCFNSLI